MKSPIFSWLVKPPNPTSLRCGTKVPGGVAQQVVVRVRAIARPAPTPRAVVRTLVAFPAWAATGMEKLGSHPPRRMIPWEFMGSNDPLPNSHPLNQRKIIQLQYSPPEFGISPGI